MIRSAARLLPAVASVIMASGAAQAGSPPAAVGPNWEESGQATWYGGRHHGRRTASGTTFDMNGLTAAHSSLPLGTRIRVTMQDTGASVVVTVTDRQPHKFIRIIDLSRGAASRIGLLSRGTAMVTLSGLRPGEAEEVAEAAEPNPFTTDIDAPVVARPKPRRAPPARARTSGLMTPALVRPWSPPVRLVAAHMPLRGAG